MARGHGRRRGGGHGGEESEERWLLTYSDMITLLMALFMVLFSISSVNISKYQVLQHSLKAAFSGNILPGGKSIAQQGASASASKAPSTTEAASIVPLTALNSGVESTSSTSAAAQAAGTASQRAAAQAAAQSAAQREAEEFAHIKRELEAFARSHGFAHSVKTSIEARGLVIRVLTDDLLFASGEANLESRADGLLNEISQLLNVDETHPIAVEGNTDDVPIRSAQFPSNWQLSTARASTVVEYLIAHGVSPHRLTATGYADQRPLASDATAAGRARNRRVEIVMKRLNGAEAEQ